MSIQVKFDNENAVKQAIQDVHNDSSDITWCCVTHLNDDPNVLTLQSTGKGGVEVRKIIKKKFGFIGLLTFFFNIKIYKKFKFSKRKQ